MAIRGGLDGAAVLDLYAGSGAVGLEALSRGAADVLLVEADARAARVIRENIALVGLPGARLVTDKVERVLARGPGDEPPRATSCSPTRRTPSATTSWPGCWPRCCATVAGSRRARWSRSSARPGREPPTWPAGYEPDRSRRYGEATLWYGLAAGAQPAATSPTGE